MVLFQERLLIREDFGLFEAHGLLFLAEGEVEEGIGLVLLHFLFAEATLQVLHLVELLNFLLVFIRRLRRFLILSSRLRLHSETLLFVVALRFMFLFLLNINKLFFAWNRLEFLDFFRKLDLSKGYFELLFSFGVEAGLTEKKFRYFLTTFDHEINKFVHQI
jgi:hypothetical protein